MSAFSMVYRLGERFERSYLGGIGRRAKMLASLVLILVCASGGSTCGYFAAHPTGKGEFAPPIAASISVPVGLGVGVVFGMYLLRKRRVEDQGVDEGGPCAH